MQTKLYIEPDGTIRAVANDALPLDGIGTLTQRRASHVWPCRPATRFAFRVLRSLFGERGRIAEWCRRWHGPWEVRFADDPHRVVFSHPSRRVCIAWEIQRLNEKLAAN
jgi:hypothetical protein